MDYQIRQATSEDAPGIAEAHVDSIRTLGPAAYPPEVVAYWGRDRDPASYLARIAAGGFFVAVDPDGSVLGFSAHTVHDGQHRIGLYVRGSAGRHGIGSVLYRAAEDHALADGAESIHLDASLIAAPFYEKHGFVQTHRGPHMFQNGDSMECVFMVKRLR